MREIEVVSDMGSDHPVHVINESSLTLGALGQDPKMRELAGQLSRWIDNARGASGRTNMFDRGMFIPPNNPYDEMRAARSAVMYDEVVAGVGEVTEAYAFQGVKWEGADADEADVFNQLAKDQNLDAVIRQMWREEYTYGQFVAAKLWGWRTYTVRGKTEKGNARKKSYRLWAPLQVRILDSTKIVPVGLGPLAGEKLAWQATLGEIGYYQAAYMGDVVDPLMLAMFNGTYLPSADERVMLNQLKVDTNRLMALNPEFVFRHTLTKPDYERFADIRLKSCFTLLDMKRQLLAADRAALVGAANYILLIRKGDKDLPAQPEEVTHLRENYNFIAKIPVIISDHRLNIDIIAPKQDFALNGEKYDTIDHRILARLLGTLSISGKGQRNETQETLSMSVARVMENRRHMLKRTLEIEIARAIVEHPKNRGTFETEPNLVYMPRNVALAFDQSYIQGLLALRTQREISRETILEYFGLDEETEAQRLELEDQLYDDIFKTEIPYSKGSPSEDLDTNLDSKDQPASLKLAVGPDGTLTATPDGPAPKKAPAKTPTKTPAKAPVKAPARKAPTTGPNGTAVAPGVSGARGGRPKGGGTTPASPAKQAKPRTPKGNVSTK